jgi:hypothetical protein
MFGNPVFSGIMSTIGVCFSLITLSYSIYKKQTYDTRHACKLDLLNTCADRSEHIPSVIAENSAAENRL